jgi:AcrR family transcriptional regulator
MQDRIIAKAHELFMRYGFRSVSMDEIATQLGVSKKTIYQYFTDKDALVESIIEMEIKGNEKICSVQKTECKDAVHEIFLALDHMGEMLENMNPSLMYDLERYHPAAFKKLRGHKNKFFYDVVKDNLERGKKEGLYREEIKNEIIAQFRLASTFLVFDGNVFPRDKYTILQLMEEVTDNYLHGIVSVKGQKLIEKYKQQRNKTQSV